MSSDKNEPSSRIKASIVAVRGRVETKSFSLEEGESLIIGRGDEADIQLLDHGLSRKHCILGRSGGSFYVEDANSRNGTWVNGKRVKRAILEPGANIRLGGVEFEFRVEPDRRRRTANLLANVPERVGGAIKERFNLDQTDLMALSGRLENLENYRRIQRALATLYKVGNLINSEPDLARLFQRLMDSVVEVTGAERGFLILAEDEGKRLRPVASVGGDHTTEGGDMSFSRTIAEECYQSGYSFFTPDATSDARVREGESIMMQRIRAAMCVPLETHERTLGVIYVDTTTQTDIFSRQDLELLAAIGKQAAIAIERAMLMERVQSRFYDTVRTLVASIEAKDVYTVGHSERVTAYAMQIAEEMGFVGEGLEDIQLAGLLHDVGKIGVPEHILNKRGRLTEEELAIIRRHPEIGANIVGNISEAENLTAIIRHHHEKYDGTGYPDGLKGEDIPIAARILSVADAYDAMTSDRPYRKALEEADVLAQFRKYAGSQFDPRVLEAFLDLHTGQRLRVPDLIYVGRALEGEIGPEAAAFSIRRATPAGAAGESSEDPDKKRAS